MAPNIFHSFLVSLVWESAKSIFIYRNRFARATLAPVLARAYVPPYDIC